MDGRKVDPRSWLQLPFVGAALSTVEAAVVAAVLQRQQLQEESRRWAWQSQEASA